MALLTTQSWRVLKSWYTGGGSEQEFRRCFADGLNKANFCLWRRLEDNCALITAQQ